MTFIEEIRQHEKTREEREAARLKEIAESHAKIDKEEYEAGYVAGTTDIGIIKRRILEAIDNRDSTVHFPISVKDVIEPHAQGRYDRIHAYFNSQHVPFELRRNKVGIWEIKFSW